MNTVKNLTAAAIAVAAFITTPALAQDSGAFQLPEQCSTSAAAGGMDHSAMGHSMGTEQDGAMGMMGMDGMDMEAMTDFQRENMAKMMETMPAMHDSVMLENEDVAFACAMIAHHQGAIDMAQIQLEYGEDEWLQTLSESIIAEQEREIEEMTQWLADNAN